MAVSRPTLASYRAECQRNVHDSTNRYWSIAEWTFYINRARDQVASDTGCVRLLQTEYLSKSLESYPIGGVTGGNVTAGGSGFTDGTYALTFAAGDGTGAAGTYTCTGGVVSYVQITDAGSGYTTAPTVTFVSGGGAAASATMSVISDYAVDIMGISVFWGNQLIPLNYMAFTEFQAKMRIFTTTFQYPCVWSRYGTSGGAAMLRPIPQQTYTAEFDTCILPTDLVADADIDTQIKYPYAKCVAYYACKLAKLKQSAYDESDKFDQMYRKNILESQASVQMRRMPNPYYGYSGA